jgi:hypothetical protein
MAQKTVLIKYIGKKDFFPDFVSQSGKNWNGYGDVQEVTAEQAKKLLVHDDEFAEKNAHDALLAKQEEEYAAAENADPAHESAPKSGVQFEQAAIEKPAPEEIAALNKGDLLALADTHAVDLNDAAPVVILRKQLIEALHPNA